jgi:hypothetical protein
MARKKWTPRAEISDALTVFREKRKWQIALRRYIIDQKWAAKYAPYFGLDTGSFRQWIELQFDDECNWGNFSKSWQFDHIVPVAYFNLQEEEDLRLCWNFTNIRVEKLESSKDRGTRIDVLAAKAYFEKLFERTGFPTCQRMVEKIEQIEVSKIMSTEKLEGFLQGKQNYLQTIADFSDYEFSRLNDGIPAEQIVEDRQFFNRIRDYN